MSFLKKMTKEFEELKANFLNDDEKKEEKKGEKKEAKSAGKQTSSTDRPSH